MDTSKKQTDARRRWASARRHPAEVTSDRLLEAVERWPGKFEGDEKDMIGMIRHALQQIADGER